jgi:hypothetical protein
METLVIAGLLLNFIGLAVVAWAVLRRKAEVAPVDHHGLRLARAALASARQMYPDAQGEPLLRHALVVFRELDLGEDGKRDFTDRQAGLYLRAEAGPANSNSR